MYCKVSVGLKGQVRSRSAILWLTGFISGCSQDLLNFPLPGKDYLEKFFCRRLQVGERVHDFESFFREVLRFVNDQHGRLAHLHTFEQPLLKCLERPQFVLGVLVEPKIAQHIIQQTPRRSCGD